MVVIKDFEMPSCCSDCPMYAWDWEMYLCCITHADEDKPSYRRNKDCPLVEIKENEDATS